MREGEYGEKTHGYVDGALDVFISGLDGTWTALVEQRLADLRVTTSLVVKRVRSHVEMKVATMMILESRSRTQLVINHVPCGSQPGQLTGCHQLLGPYLPLGYALTVLGTTQRGEPFAKTYRGCA